MRLETADKVRAKGWYCGPWDKVLVSHSRLNLDETEAR